MNFDDEQDSLIDLLVEDFSEFMNLLLTSIIFLFSQFKIVLFSKYNLL